MKHWIVECDEMIRACSQYVVEANSKAEARAIVIGQDNRRIIDKPKSFEEAITVTKITSIKPF
jgi:hypothetical protein